jgi:hypothetical protein
MSANPTALQLRYLRILVELGSSEASTIVFPTPIDLLRRARGCRRRKWRESADRQDRGACERPVDP